MVLIRPHKATHAALETAEGKKALVAIGDLDTLEGSAGSLTWMRVTKQGQEVIKTITFDGQIESLESDYRKNKTKSKRRKPTG